MGIFYSVYLVRDYKMAFGKRGIKESDPLERPKIHSLNLIEDLGEVEYLMTDKTGTLTKNSLSLVAACADSQESFVSE